MIKLTIWLMISAASAVFYRMGGSGKYNTKFRDLGCPTCAFLLLVILWKFSWLMIPAFGLNFGAMTTYWKKKGSDTKWWNWFLHGLVLGIAMFPLIWAGIAWQVILIRAILVGSLVALWSEWQGNVVWEEYGRGAIYTATIPLLFC